LNRCNVKLTQVLFHVLKNCMLCTSKQEINTIIQTVHKPILLYFVILNQDYFEASLLSTNAWLSTSC